MADGAVTRRGLCAGALAAAAGSAVAVPVLVEAQGSADDRSVLELILLIERTETAFYGAALDAGILDGELAEFAEVVRGHEAEHLGAVAAALGDRVAVTGAQLDVVTHAVPVAHTLSLLNDVGLTILGGQVRGLTAAAVGTATLTALDSLRPDLAFVGTNGVSADFGLSTPDPAEAAVKAAIVGAARRTVLVADQAKFGVESFVRFARLIDIDILVTDAAPDEELAAALAAADVEVWTA